MGTSTSTEGQRLHNFLIAAVAIVLSLALVVAVRGNNQRLTLAEQATQATPWAEAQTNGKPTLLEFYANWCSSCRAMAKDLAALKAVYQDRVNFVMLNVDNSKWLPEIQQFGVDGVPHFVFLNARQEVEGVAIGLQPKEIMAKNLEALSQGLPLPHSQNRGDVSQLSTGALATQHPDDPCSHGD